MDVNDPYFEAIMSLTSSSEWKLLIKELEKMVYEIQANGLEAESWDTLNENRGFAKGLAYMINLRESTKLEKVAEDADV